MATVKQCDRCKTIAREGDSSDWGWLKAYSNSGPDAGRTPIVSVEICETCLRYLTSEAVTPPPMLARDALAGI